MFYFIWVHGTDTKTIFYLIYKITKVFSSLRDVIHVSVLQYKMKMTSNLSPGRVLFYKYIYKLNEPENIDISGKKCGEDTP